MDDKLTSELISAIRRLTVSVDRLSADLREYYLQDESPPPSVADLSSAGNFVKLPCELPEWATHLAVDADGRAAALDGEPVPTENSNWGWNGHRGKWLDIQLPDMASQCIKVR